MYTEKEIKEFEEYILRIIKIDKIGVRDIIDDIVYNFSEKEKDIFNHISSEVAYKVFSFTISYCFLSLFRLILKNPIIKLELPYKKNLSFFNKLIIKFDIWEPYIVKNVINLIIDNPNFNINMQDNNNGTLLHFCASRNYLGLVKKILVKDNVDINSVNKDFQSPLFLATAYENQEIIDLLLVTEGINKNIFANDKIKLFINAIRNKFFNIVKLIVENTEDGLKYFYDNHINPLTIAIFTSDIIAVKFILDLKNIDVNFQSLNCYPALHIATRGKNIEIIKLLLQNSNTNVNLQDSHGGTALHNAAQFKDYSILKLLLEIPNIDINIVNDDNETALYKAVRGEKLENIRILLAQPKIDVNPIPNSGFYKGVTIFQIAIKRNNKDLAEMLFKRDDVDFTLPEKINSNPDHWIHQMIEDRNMARFQYGEKWFDESSECCEASINTPQVKLLAEEGSDEEVSNDDSQN